LKFENKPIEEYPLPRTRPVSGRWKNEGTEYPYTVIDIDVLLEAHRLSIRTFINKLIEGNNND
jgi:hypothetical protein